MGHMEKIRILTLKAKIELWEFIMKKILSTDSAFQII